MSDLPNLTPLHAALQTWRDACKRRRAQERATEQMVTTLLAGYVGEDTYQRVKLIADAEHAVSGLAWRYSTGADKAPIDGLFAALHLIGKPHLHGLVARIAAIEERETVEASHLTLHPNMTPAEAMALFQEMRQHDCRAPDWDRQGPVR